MFVAVATKTEVLSAPDSTCLVREAYIAHAITEVREEIFQNRAKWIKRSPHIITYSLRHFPEKENCQKGKTFKERIDGNAGERAGEKERVSIVYISGTVHSLYFILSHKVDKKRH